MNQLIYLVGVLFGFIGFGVPISMPPGVEDPFLARIAPETCVYYTNWAGAVSPDPNSNNQIEKLLSETEMQSFADYLNKGLGKVLLDSVPAVGDRQGLLIVEAGHLGGKLLVTQPLSLFVNGLAMDPVNVEAGLVIRLDDNKQATEEVLKKLETAIFRGTVTDVAIDDTHRFRQTEIASTKFTWGIDDNYLMVGIGERSIAGILDRAKTPVPTWLSDLQAEYTLPRRATLTCADLQALIKIVAAMLPDAAKAELSAKSPLQHLRSYVSVSGLNAERFICRTDFLFDEKAQAARPPISSQPLTIKELRPIPANAIVAVAIKTNLQKSLESALDLLAVLNLASRQETSNLLDSLARSLAIDLKKELLQCLGDVLTVHTSVEDGGMLTGWIATISVVDAAGLEASQVKVVESLNKTKNLKVIHSEVDGHAVKTIRYAAFPFAPSWCLTGDEIVFGVFPQAVREHLRAGKDRGSLADLPRVKELFRGGQAPSIVAYQDTSYTMRELYPAVQMGIQSFGSMLTNEGIDIDVTRLPSMSALTRNVKPSLWAVSHSGNRYRIESFHSLPGSSMAAAAPLVFAASLPAITAARESSRRTTSGNNLRQLGLAIMNYESVHKSYPAAYNADKNGKPLLSWRVHILPYLEESELYNEFQLDEPWDSPRNRKLIARMPRFFRAPNSQADPGKTNYVTIRDPHGVILPPASNQNGTTAPQGLRMREIIDGTSNTIMMVEAGDEQAVVWTKPDDWTPGDGNPVKALMGLHQGVFMAVFCDGSLRAIPESLSPDKLRALFTRDGAEEVGSF
ncbi:MAG: DUF1559 domain-containing protein [Planctomycetaceae bacterium]|nr:DUF1559 domain-containing protein [Planctomycetaceae bacterium]